MAKPSTIRATPPTRTHPEAGPEPVKASEPDEARTTGSAVEAGAAGSSFDDVALVAAADVVVGAALVGTALVGVDEAGGSGADVVL